MGVSNGQLLWAILRSRKARGLNREVVGQQFSERLGGGATGGSQGLRRRDQRSQSALR